MGKTQKTSVFIQKKAQKVWLTSSIERSFKSPAEPSSWVLWSALDKFQKLQFFENLCTRRLFQKFELPPSFHLILFNRAHLPSLKPMKTSITKSSKKRRKRREGGHAARAVVMEMRTISTGGLLLHFGEKEMRSNGKSDNYELLWCIVGNEKSWKQLWAARVIIIIKW